MENFPRDFKGIWIPRELWLDRRLSCLERQLIAEIHSLDCGEDHCYASNDHFERLFNSASSTIKEALSHLKKLGYWSLISFDGRTRVIKSNLEDVNKKVQSSENKYRTADGQFSGRQGSSFLDGGSPMSPHSAGDTILDTNKKEVVVQKKGGAAPKPPTTTFLKDKKKGMEAPKAKETVEEAIKKNVPEGDRLDDALADYAQNKEMVDSKLPNPPGWFLTREKNGGCKGSAQAERQRKERELSDKIKWAENSIGGILQIKEAKREMRQDGVNLTLRSGESKFISFNETKFEYLVCKFLEFIE